MVSVKNVLDDFALATGLTINYIKTTFLPISLEEDHAHNLASFLDTAVSSFPQPYLGLPLTPHEVSVSDYSPLIASCDRYLAGWKATLLNRAGRLLLGQVELTDVSDERRMRSTGRPFSSRGAYAALAPQSSIDDNGVKIWKLKIPNKVKESAKHA
ncbi:hypothetical protein U9M48_021777 [Paspalum notatum var. saurae]|uniref:Uncharacterized protein n=1 Tax=Paspalum notatum var. saurae TaxID=547442 RepID=A0AAQ3WUB1_PASNO